MNRVIHKVYLIVFLIAFASQQKKCRYAAKDEELPDCISEKIIKPEKRMASLSVWEYQGKTVYLEKMICCDIPSELFDADCNVLGFPDWGMVHTDHRCDDFYTSAKKINDLVSAPKNDDD